MINRRIPIRLDDYQQKPRSSRRLGIPPMSILLLFLVATIGEVAAGSDDGLQTTTVGFSKMVNSACAHTPYPRRCESSLHSYSYQTETDMDVMKATVKVSMERAEEARDFAMSLENNYIMNARERAAWQDCVELFQDTMERLNVCLSEIERKGSVPTLTFLSASLTNQETCLNGFRDMNLSDSSSTSIRALMSSTAVNLSELVSNSLSMHKQKQAEALKSQKQNRRLLSDEFEFHVRSNGFPEWLSAADRRLLQSSSPANQANVVVAQDGSATYRTIAEAVAAAPQKSSKRYVIYVKAGIYKENVVISNKMTNFMFVGDGKDKTVITGNKNVQDGTTTFRSATFAVSGDGFIARDMTFENTAGAQKHQAVALRVGADQSVVYRCSIKGYQDTLYVYSLRQFYSQVDIYGTVDFIFGNAAVVIQNSNILARKPLSNQKNTITAQGRTDPNQNTGISIHKCVVAAASDLQPYVDSVKTYLGRPWQQYSRTVFMQTTLGDLVDPAGWMEWDATFALDTLYYGEYLNTGAGAHTSRRVNWPGFHLITSIAQASQFSVGQFISGDSWISATGVPFTSGLN
uniref:Pectinesterase n=1 Tax=Araucaria cunninghamii TaxID=56994 RepID=A0A0D6R300_ARACU